MHDVTHDAKSCGDFGNVCGNIRLRRYLAGEIRRGATSHAYIIEGAAGSGRHALAYDFAAALLCGDKCGAIPCGHCPQCVKVASGGHPDVKLITRGTKASIGVDVVRSLCADVAVIPSEAEYKVYIIEDADKMTVGAQNAFLLTLEEPPEYALWLLLSADASSLLDTVRSRAPVLRLAPVGRDELRSYLASKGKLTADTGKSPDKSGGTVDIGQLLVCAAGNPGVALALTDPKKYAVRMTERGEAEKLLSVIMTGGAEAYIAIAAMKRMKRETATQLLSDTGDALRDMIMSKKTRNFETCFYPDTDTAAAAASEYTARRLCAAAESVSETSRLLSANAAVYTALLATVIRIRDIR